MLEIEHNLLVLVYLSLDLSKVRPFLFLGFVDTMEFFVMKRIKAESFFLVASSTVGILILGWRMLV